METLDEMRLVGGYLAEMMEGIAAKISVMCEIDRWVCDLCERILEMFFWCTSNGIIHFKFNFNLLTCC